MHPKQLEQHLNDVKQIDIFLSSFLNLIIDYFKVLNRLAICPNRLASLKMH